MHSDSNQRVKKYYVYGHYTKTTQEVFYIGVGTIIHLQSKTHTQRYNRAYHFSNRTNFWNNTKEKYGIEVKILFEYETKKESLDKEKELIEQFGRKVMGTGLLVNISEGGEIGPTGRVFKMSQEQKDKLSSSKSHTFYVYNKDGDFLKEILTIKKTAEYCGVTYNAIHSCMKTKNYSNGFFIFKEFKGTKLDYTVEDVDFQHSLSKKVITRSSINGLTTTHKSLKDASVYLKTDRSNLRKAIKNNRLCKKHYVRFL